MPSVCQPFKHPSRQATYQMCYLPGHTFIDFFFFFFKEQNIGKGLSDCLSPKSTQSKSQAFILYILSNNRESLFKFTHLTAMFLGELHCISFWSAMQGWNTRQTAQPVLALREGYLGFKNCFMQKQALAAIAALVFCIFPRAEKYSDGTVHCNSSSSLCIVQALFSSAWTIWNQNDEKIVHYVFSSLTSATRKKSKSFSTGGKHPHPLDLADSSLSASLRKNMLLKRQ